MRFAAPLSMECSGGGGAPPGTAEKRRELQAKLHEMGGLRVYQAASKLTTAQNKCTSRYVFDMCNKFGLRPAKGEPKLKVLEVGAVNAQLLACPYMEVQAIDKNSNHPQIEEKDFFDVALTGRLDLLVKVQFEAWRDLAASAASRRAL